LLPLQSNRDLILAGPTGVGKSAIAVALAERVQGEIVNYDSVQVYRGFDIGSAKPSVEARRRVPHHLLDIVNAYEPFTAADFSREARRVSTEIRARNRTPIFVGGTGFYLRAYLGGLSEMPGRDETIRARLRSIAASGRGQERLHRWLLRIDPVSGSRISPKDRHRVERALEVHLITGRPISSWPRLEAGSGDNPTAVRLAITVDRSDLVNRINRRVEEMYQQGLVEETRLLLEIHDSGCRPFQTIGYREAVRILQNELSVESAIAETQRRTRAYAKRQMTWLRGERGVTWIENRGIDETVSRILNAT